MEITKEIFGCESKGKRIAGLIDAENEKEFDILWEEAKQKWPRRFVGWLNGTKGRMRTFPNMIKKSMLKPVRVAAGLGIVVFFIIL